MTIIMMTPIKGLIMPSILIGRHINLMCYKDFHRHGLILILNGIRKRLCHIMTKDMDFEVR